MKRLSSLIPALALVALLCGTAFAETCASKGSTVIPSVRYRLYSSTHQYWHSLDLSNISGSDVTCTVKLFDHTGAQVTDNIIVKEGSTSSTAFTTLPVANNTFDIPAGRSRHVIIYKENSNFVGYGVIEWCSTDPRLSKALVGTVQRFGINNTNGSYGGEYPLNAAQPF